MTLKVIQPYSGDLISLCVNTPAVFANRTVATQMGLDMNGVNRYWPTYDPIGAMGGWTPPFVLSVADLFGLHMPTDVIEHQFTGNKPVARQHSYITEARNLNSFDIGLNLLQGKAGLPLIPTKEKEVDHMKPLGTLLANGVDVPGQTVTYTNSTYAGLPITYVTRKRLANSKLVASVKRPFWRTTVQFGSTTVGVDIEAWLKQHFVGKTRSYGYATTLNLKFGYESDRSFYIEYEHTTSISGYIQHWKIRREFIVELGPIATQYPVDGMTLQVRPVTLTQYLRCTPLYISNDPNAKDTIVQKLISTPLLIPVAQAGETLFDRQSLITHLYGARELDNSRRFPWRDGLFGSASSLWESSRPTLNALARSAFLKAVGNARENWGKGVNLAEAAMEYDQLFDTLVDTPECLDILFNETRVPKWARDVGITKISDFRKVRSLPRDQLKQLFQRVAGHHIIGSYKSPIGLSAVVRSVSVDYLRLIFGAIPAVSLLLDIPAVATVLQGMGMAKSGVAYGKVQYSLAELGDNCPFSTVRITATAKIRFSVNAHSFGSLTIPWSAAGFSPLNLGTWLDLVPSSWLATSLSKRLRDLVSGFDDTMDSMMIGVDFTVVTIKVEFVVSEEFAAKIKLKATAPGTFVIQAFSREIVAGNFPDNGIRVDIGDNVITNGVTIGAYALVKVL